MVRGCSGDCCKGKYQGEPVVLEGIEGELKRWLVQHEVEPWLQNNSLLNKAILHVVSHNSGAQPVCIAISIGRLTACHLCAPALTAYACDVHTAACAPASGSCENKR
jgi:hypothetical protein